MIGRILAGRYRIDASIGEGGMSRVWRALDLNTGKDVAVKILRDEFRADETFIRRFEREALAASRMTHPNIVNLLDVGAEPDGMRYLVIEYVSGKTLKQLIRESGAIRPEIATQIIIRVLAALGHAHKNGVIHRDIKPQNILIDRAGVVKVADFGIARVANANTGNQENESVMGSVYYFSPEQAKGGDVDEKSDLYSVGAMLYEMLTGELPFTGDTPVAIAMQHLRERPVPPSKRRAGISPALDTVVLHAMEKKPALRYASAEDMLRDVRLAMEHPDTILAAHAEQERMRRKEDRDKRRVTRAQRRVRLLRHTLLGVLTLALLGIIAFGAYRVTQSMLARARDRVEVPSFIGWTMGDAINRIIELGLEPVIRYDAYPLVPDNVVADQSVAAGTMMSKGTILTIIVCQSEYDLRMPNVIGMPYAQAHETLLEAGVVVAEPILETSEAALMMVIRQTPEAGGGMNIGDTAQLTVSGGMVVMPRLVGQTQAAAEQTLIAFGLTLADVREEIVTDPSQIGVVVAQEPAAFGSVMPGSSVVMTIGVADLTLLETDVMLGLGSMQDGTTVTIYVADEVGEMERQYSQYFEEGGGELTVTLYSRTARETYYEVFFDNELIYRFAVEFLP